MAAAALVPVMVAAGMTLAMVMAALVTVFVVMAVVVALRVGVIGKPSFRQSLCRNIRRALYASVELDSGFR